MQDILVLGPVLMVSSLVGEVSGTDVELSWSGNSDEYRIYLSSSPTESLEDMRLVGVTTENSWSHTAPIASNLYYSVTQMFDDNEILWIENGTNTVGVDASSATTSVDDSPTGSITILSIQLTIIFLMLALLSIGMNLQIRKRRSMI
jgi:fibronectin type 3 domain-containing protein